MISQWLLRLSAVILYWLCSKKGERESVPILYKNDSAILLKNSSDWMVLGKLHSSLG